MVPTTPRTPGRWLGRGCALLAVIEAGALLARRDRFWSGPSARLATIAEALAVPASLAAATALLFAPVVKIGRAHV